MKTYTKLFQGPLTDPSTVAALREGRPTCWLRETISSASALSAAITHTDLDMVVDRFTRFAPVLAKLFVENRWDGRVCSELIEYKANTEGYQHLVKADHALPMTGSIKARGGVYELLCYIEQIGFTNGLVTSNGSYEALCSDQARGIFKNHSVVVASTGNLGFSIGLVARAFGIDAEIHMSQDAKEWKKDRLRSLGARVIEHSCDYSETVARARASSQGRAYSHFVDDENSRTLLLGYSGAGRELAVQLEEHGIAINPQRPLIVYLPCGVGGAPGGITLGLKASRVRMWRGDRRFIATVAAPFGQRCLN
jgi:D-serine dehydratase